MLTRAFDENVGSLPVMNGLQEALDHGVQEVFQLGNLLECHQLDFDQTRTLFAQLGKPFRVARFQPQAFAAVAAQNQNALGTQTSRRRRNLQCDSYCVIDARTQWAGTASVTVTGLQLLQQQTGLMNLPRIVGQPDTQSLPVNVKALLEFKFPQRIKQMFT